jgi:transcription-repair coupling factor (superfamily II helicase)
LKNGTIAVDDFKRLADSPDALTVCGTPDGFDALIFCDALRARGGVGLFIASDEARASAFRSACAFSRRTSTCDCRPGIASPMTGSAQARARRRGAPARCIAWRRAPDADASPFLVITTAASVIQRCAPREAMGEGGLIAAPGAVLDIEVLKAHLAKTDMPARPRSPNAAITPIRGGVVDVFPG